MNRVFIVLLLALLTPAFASAAMLYSNTSAQSSSGGLHAGPGQSVSRDDSDSSVQITTNMNNSGAQTTVTTEENGVSETHTYNQSGSGNGITVDIATSTSSHGLGSQVVAHVFVQAHATGTPGHREGTSSKVLFASTSVSAQLFGSSSSTTLFGHSVFSDFFTKLLRFFSWW